MNILQSKSFEDALNQVNNISLPIDNDLISINLKKHNLNTINKEGFQHWKNEFQSVALLNMSVSQEYLINAISKSINFHFLNRIDNSKISFDKISINVVEDFDNKFINHQLVDSILNDFKIKNNISFNQKNLKLN